jgi:hypothetical protein
MKLTEIQVAQNESEQKKQTNNSKPEIDTLKTKIVSAEKAIIERAKAHDRQRKVLNDEAKAERDALENEYKRQSKQRDEQARAQDEAYKHKLQYLELAQKDVKTERKRWQEKEKEFERNLVATAGELRELRADHAQAVELHEAFKAHIEAKEAARATEAANWELKKKALAAEHKLAVRHVEVEKNARIAHLEREIAKAKDDLGDAQEEVERLTEEVGAGGDLMSPEPTYEEKKFDRLASSSSPSPSKREVASPTTPYDRGSVSSPVPAKSQDAATDAAPPAQPRQVEGQVEEGAF